MAHLPRSAASLTATSTAIEDTAPAAEARRQRLAAPASVWLLAFGLATVLGALSASQTYLSMLDHGHSWWRLFLWQWLYWSFWAALTPWVLRIGAGRLQSERSRATWLITSAATALGLAGLHLVFAAALTLWIQPFVPVADYSLRQALRRGLAPWVLVDLLVYTMLVATGYALAAYLHARRLELRESRLEAELARAQLDALRLEIQPHFLFNTLNSISTLVRRGATDAAVAMIVGLSDLLRATLDRADRQWGSLGEELDLVRRYIDLQRARFADRLSVSYAIDDDLLDTRVPFLLLQPLVENSIRHGVARRAAPCHIEIRARRRGAALEIIVSDDGPGLPTDFSLTDSSGVGLRNVRSRLGQLYGAAASLELTSRSAAGTRCSVTLPPAPEEPRLATAS